MLAVKVLLEKHKRDSAFVSSFKNVVIYLKRLLNNELSIINDSNCIEVVSSSNQEIQDGIKVELLFKKTIYINKHNFEENLKKEIESFNKKID